MLSSHTWMWVHGAANTCCDTEQDPHRGSNRWQGHSLSGLLLSSLYSHMVLFVELGVNSLLYDLFHMLRDRTGKVCVS